VFTKIFNTPGSTYAQKWKHVIEPTLTISRARTHRQRLNIVQLESYDQRPAATRSTYACNNRLYAKKESSREISRRRCSRPITPKESPPRWTQLPEHVDTAASGATSRRSRCRCTSRRRPITTRRCARIRHRRRAAMTIRANGGMAWVDVPMRMEPQPQRPARSQPPINLWRTPQRDTLPQGRATLSGAYGSTTT
jgi:hypothetical protein